MKRMTISKKFTTITIIVTAIMFVVGYLVLNNYKDKLTLEVC
jgi:methyl-accepting chemotaxis protein